MDETPEVCGDMLGRGLRQIHKRDRAKVNRRLILRQSRLVGRETLVTAGAGVWKRKREDLQNRRTSLFKRFERNPSDLRLALEIRTIDDQIAECTQQMERENLELEPVADFNPHLV